MKAPVYVLYGLDNFYQVYYYYIQNHRRYQQSYNYDQLQGKYPSESDLKDSCDPLYKTEDGKLLYPCGLIANSFFNGIYILFIQILLN